MIISQFPAGANNNIMPQFTYTGDYDIVQEAEGWKVRFLTSGTLILGADALVDIFAVGGGGDGSLGYQREYVDNNGGEYREFYYGAGGGGHVKTESNVTLTAATSYTVTVGAHGQDSSFGTICTASAGGDSPASMTGGGGGSGGASGGIYVTNRNGNYISGQKIMYGGIDGADGEEYMADQGGEGSGTTTREFGDPSGVLYASGGNAFSSYENSPAIQPNTGNGGHGGHGNIYGASGIVIIRNARSAS